MEFVYRFSRDNARTPMQWDGSDNAGFTSGRPWLPVNDDHVNVNAQDEMQDGRSVLAWYKTLAALRTENHVLTHGDYREVMEDSDSIFAFVRSDENDKLVTLVNFSGTDQVCDIEVEEILLSSYQDGGSIPGRLRPYEAVIARLP
jgi:glycosidase